MLRYFYILCLLICIDWSFCYDYISSGNKARRMKNGRLRHKRDRRYHGLKYKGYEEADGEYPKAEIDVASFLQRPDYDADDDRSQNEAVVELNSGKPLPKNYYGYKFLSHKNVENINDENRINSLEANYVSNVDIGQQRQEKRESANRCEQKKKFPFFSRKKSGRAKLRKKKKFFGLGKKKLKTTATLTSPVIPSSSPKNKRSYEEQICPFCQKKYTKKRENTINGPVHNSRQYFQNLAVKSVSKDSKPILSSSVNLEDAYNQFDKLSHSDDRYNRRKRQYKDNARERQLKELEEVQRKIDSVEVSTKHTQT